MFFAGRATGLAREKIAGQHALHFGNDAVAFFARRLLVGEGNQPFTGFAHDAEHPIQIGRIGNSQPLEHEVFQQGREDRSWVKLRVLWSLG